MAVPFSLKDALRSPGFSTSSPGDMKYGGGYIPMRGEYGGYISMRGKHALEEQKIIESLKRQAEIGKAEDHFGSETRTPASERLVNKHLEIRRRLTSEMAMEFEAGPPKFVTFAISQSEKELNRACPEVCRKCSYMAIASESIKHPEDSTIEVRLSMYCKTANGNTVICPDGMAIVAGKEREATYSSPVDFSPIVTPKDNDKPETDGSGDHW